MPRVLLAIPVYNEAEYIDSVISKVTEHAEHVLVIDDGSTDETPTLLAKHAIEVVRHSENRGYGRAMQDMFHAAAADGFDWLLTMDCDEQHEPAAIPEFMERIEKTNADVISGSRYLDMSMQTDIPPADRRRINLELTQRINARLDMSITDSFCGFKAYRVSAIERMHFDVDGYDFPMQFWVKAAAFGLSVEEIAIKLIYNDPSRTFGGPLDDSENRLAVYLETFEREIERCEELLPRVISHS